MCVAAGSSITQCSGCVDYLFIFVFYSAILFLALSLFSLPVFVLSRTCNNVEFDVGALSSKKHGGAPGLEGDAGQT